MTGQVQSVTGVLLLTSRTSLHRALQEGRLAAAALLLKAGASLSDGDEQVGTVVSVCLLLSYVEHGSRLLAHLTAGMSSICSPCRTWQAKTRL